MLCIWWNWRYLGGISLGLSVPALAQSSAWRRHCLPQGDPSRSPSLCWPLAQHLCALDENSGEVDEVLPWALLCPRYEANMLTAVNLLNVWWSSPLPHPPVTNSAPLPVRRPWLFLLGSDHWLFFCSYASFPILYFCWPLLVQVEAAILVTFHILTWTQFLPLLFKFSLQCSGFCQCSWKTGGSGWFWLRIPTPSLR